MNRLTALSVFLLILLAGCGARQPATMDADNPLLNVTVEPVTAPQLYRYGPAIGQLEYKIGVETEKETLAMTMLLKYSVIEQGDALLWHLFVPEWTQNGDLIKPSVPLMDITMDTDRRGNVGKTDITFPVVKAYNITDPEALKAFEDMSKNMTSMSVHLPEEPIVSGDPIYPANMQELEGMLTDIDRTPYHTLEGEFTFDGIRYVSTVMNEVITGRDKKSGIRLSLSMNIRSILRKENMEAEYGFGTIVGRDSNGSTLFTTRVMFTKTESDLSH